MTTAKIILAAAVPLVIGAGKAVAQQWQPVSDRAAVVELLSGHGLDAPSFADFYRADGAMGYFNKDFGTVVVRQWKVADDGTVCTYIYVRPENLVECLTFERSATDPNRVRMTIVDRGYKQDATLTDTPMPELARAIEAVAGPME